MGLDHTNFEIFIQEYARSECGNIVKTEEIAPPQNPQVPVQPRPQPQTQYKIPVHVTQYKIPQPSNSFADVTSITNVTQLSVISKSPIDSVTDIFAKDGEGAESADDPDYNPVNMDSREADAEDEEASDDASRPKSGASSLRTYHAGATSASLYSHPPETSQETKVRVSTWLDTAKARTTRPALL
jgi:hypothetical protein